MRNLHGTPNIVTYLASLNMVDDQVVEFTCESSEKGKPDVASLTVSREHWESSGMPTVVEVVLKQWHPVVAEVKDEWGLASKGVPGNPLIHHKDAPPEPWPVTDPF